MANKTKYNLRHIRCNMADFNADCHRFRFEYDGIEMVVTCHQRIWCDFDKLNIPEDIQTEIANIIFSKFDRGEENKWRYPQEAYDIADAYCEENFK